MMEFREGTHGWCDARKGGPVYTTQHKHMHVEAVFWHASTLAPLETLLWAYHSRVVQQLEASRSTLSQIPSVQRRTAGVTHLKSPILFMLYKLRIIHMMFGVVTSSTKFDGETTR